MKKKSPVIEFYRIVRWKKHLKKVAEEREKKQKFKDRMLEAELSEESSQPDGALLALERAKLSNAFDVLYKNARSPTPKELKNHRAIFKVPKKFDIYESPESVFKAVASFRLLALNSRINKIRIIHDEVDTCMSSESLLGILGAEIDDIRTSTGCRAHIDGYIHHSPSNSALIENTSLVAEIEDGKILGKPSAPIEKIFSFKKDNKLFQSPSMTADDIKNETAKECIDQLCEGLVQLRAKLNKDVADELKMCLGEILDNAQEHCHRTSPTWYVRSYLNTNEDCERYFELMVMNIGASISETFQMLNDGSLAKQDAMNYANAHSKIFHIEELITVAALQGNVSSKKDEEVTRGQGTVRLIETFENISKAYARLRGEGKASKKNKPIMNIISGSSVIRFDGRYHSHKIEHSDGSEDVYITFNNENSLQLAPDRSSVIRMSKAYFPGVMINIRIPLNGSVTPIDGIH